MKSSKELYRVVVVAVALVSSVVGQRQKNLHIKNHGQKAEIYWLDDGGEMVLQAPSIDNGQTLFLSKCLSYVLVYDDCICGTYDMHT